MKEWETFKIEKDPSSNSYFLVSETWSGKVFQCQPDGKACISNTNRDAWERLTI